MGESYDGIRALADLFRIVKIPNKLSGTVAGEWLLYLSSNLVGPRIFIFQKKILSFAFPYLYLDPRYPLRLHTFLLFLPLPLPPLPLEGYPHTHLPTLWGESLEPSSLDLVPHSAMRFIPHS